MRGGLWRWSAAALTVALLAGLSGARGDEGAAPARVGAGFLAGLGYLGSGVQHGAVLVLGAHLAMGPHASLALDLGYGAVGREGTPFPVEDRWWIMPSAALAAPLGRARLEIGGGLGLGATSGYTSFAGYVKAPFNPVWALQLVPALRGQVGVLVPVARRLDVLVRLEAAALLVEGNKVGSRVDYRLGTDAGDTVWVALLVGVRYGAR